MTNKKTIAAVSGSASLESSNTALLEALKNHFKSDYNIEIYTGLRELPLFTPEKLERPTAEVKEWKDVLSRADAVIFCTPEYSHNIPAILKNGLEWITQSGELSNKRVLPVTFTPKAPRGEFAMKSLLFTLQTLKAQIMSQMPLYRNEVEYENGKIMLNEDYKMLWQEALYTLLGANIT